ncbi:MAG: hypothetical protein LLG02_17365 [Pelosinus sp.]|nr:hypothetical protein [Pelosinus sp.]
MRKIGQTLVSQGYDAEFHHCSSDNNSLDGVVIPKLGVAFIDKANEISQEMIAEIFIESRTAGAGKFRKLFASAITPDGLINYLDSSVWPMGKCQVIGGGQGSPI